MGVHAAWPLIGRVEELRLIGEWTAHRDVPAGVVLAGAAGVGKTRLAREALELASGRGAAVRWAMATASARVLPLGAFIPLLGELGSDPSQLLRKARAALVPRAPHPGVVVGVDDAHLLDELSALLVHQLVSQRVAAMVVTVRSGEPAPDAISALWKDGHLRRLEIQPLSEPETATLAEAVLGGPLDSASARRLWALTRGNPLYLHHLLDGETEAGRLHLVGGVWVWSGELSLSPGLVELLTARMGALSQPVGAVLDILSLAEPLDIALLADLCDPLGLEEAEARGLIATEQDGPRWQARLAHPLYGEVRRAALGQLRARRLRGEIATKLAAVDSRRREDILRRAILLLDSDLRPDPGPCTVAARTAMQRLDFPLAERLAEAAVNAGGGFESELTLCYARTWLGRREEADRELAALGQRAGSDLQRAQVLLPRVVNLFWTLRRPAEAEAVLEESDAVLTDPAARSTLTAARAAFHADLGRPRQAVLDAKEALAAVSLPEQAVVLATWGLVGGLGMLGQADQLGAAAKRGYAAAAEGFDAPVLRLGLSYRHTLGLRLAGYLDEANRVAVQAHRNLADAPGWFALGGLVLLGQAVAARGDLGSALRWLREARAGLQSFGDIGGWLFRCLLSLTQILAMSGEAVPAKQTLVELEDVRHPGFSFLAPELMLARAWVAAAEGAVSHAVALAHQAAGLAAERGQVAHEVLALQTAVSFGDHSQAARLARLAIEVDGPRAGIVARFAEALAAADGSELASVSEEFERIGDMIAAVDAAAHAAISYRAKGLRGSALSCSTRADALGERCGACTPALRRASERVPLTDREHEIVMLLGEGLSTRAVAERLTLSMRTVENHIYRAMAKTGTGTREELAALLRPHRPTPGE